MKNLGKLISTVFLAFLLIFTAACGSTAGSSQNDNVCRCSENQSSENSQSNTSVLGGGSTIGAQSNDNSTSNSLGETTKTSTSEKPSASNNVVVKPSNSTSSVTVEPTTPTTTYSYLDGTLYGDDDFVAKIKTAAKREVETVNEIPSDAIFVSASGSDSASGTIDAPLLTLSKALSRATTQVKNGGSGTIIMRGGTYGHTYFYATAQGTKDNYIVVTNYPGETVKISEAANSTGLFHLGTSNYVIIEGLTFCDNVGTKTAKGITANGDGINHIIIKNNEFYNITVPTGSSDKNNAPIINFRGTNANNPNSNFLVYNNYIHDCATGWSEALTFVGNCEYINVIQNTIKDTGNIGIDIAGNWGDVSGANDQTRYVVVRGNDVSGCNSPYARSYALYCDGARDVIFENNKAYNSQGGIEIGSENKTTDYPVTNIIIRNNLVYNNSQKGVSIGGYNVSKAGVVKNVEVYNNTSVNNGYEESGDQLALTMVDGVSIYNNIFVSSKSGGYVIGGDTAVPESYILNVTFNNNLYYNFTAGSSDIKFRIGATALTGIDAFKQYDKNAMCFDPDFVDLSAFDLHLKSTSKAIDCGVTPTYALYDLDKVARTSNIIDLGCYEFYA